MAPKKVVKANQDYTAKFAGELSFKKGDFFYVITERSDDKYEVMNPIQKVRGVVPAMCFDNLDKVRQDSLKSPTSPPQQTWDTLISALIQHLDQKEDGRWYYTIEIKYSDKTTQILFRTFDDFWVLHVALLNHFPAESGRTGRGRIIPFLPPPVSMSSKEANMRKKVLESYLNELIRLPSHMLNASPCKRFFLSRTGDLNTALNIRFDASESLLDLLADYEDEDHIKVTLKLGEEALSWEEDVTLTCEQLYATVQEYLGFKFKNLLYKDECDTMIPLTGNRDLELLIRTWRDHLVFYVS